MSKVADRFVITRGVNNSFTFSIKEDNSTLLKNLTGWTFTAQLYRLHETPPGISLSILNNNPTTGRVVLNIPANETTNLVSEKGDKVDRFYLKPTYKLIITGTKHPETPIIAKVEEVYVD